MLTVRGLEKALRHFLEQDQTDLQKLSRVLSAGLLKLHEQSLQSFACKWNGPTNGVDLDATTFRALEATVLEWEPVEADYRRALEYARSDLEELEPYAKPWAKFFAVYTYLKEFERGISGKYIAFFTLERMQHQASRDGSHVPEGTSERMTQFALRGGGTDHREVRKTRRLYDRIKKECA